MPTYDYFCENCEYSFEYFQNMSDEPLEKCPQCGKNIKRLIGSGLGVIFRGNGFYANDSKNKSNSTEKPSSSKKDDTVKAGKEKTAISGNS